MSMKSKDILGKENIVQAIVVADCFDDEFLPISDHISLALLPLVNKPLIDYTLEFLSLGGIEETFLFCCMHIEQVRNYINKGIQESAEWSINMKVNIIASESCRSFGDCLRDLDAKGVLRGDFVLLEPGTISNVELLPLLKKHNAITKSDKGAVMTLIYQEAGIHYFGRSSHEDVVLAANSSNRVLFHKKIGKSRERKVEFPLEIFLENSEVSLLHNLKDTHIAICSPAVLPLFTDNFDYQTKDDFVRGMLILNEEILAGTIYYHVLKGEQFGGAVTSWRMYQALSRELTNRWIYPLVPNMKYNTIMKNEVVVAKTARLGTNPNLSRTVLGENVQIGDNVQISDSFILNNAKIGDNVIITHSVIGQNVVIKNSSKVTAGSILGKDVIIEAKSFIENTLVQSTEPDYCGANDKINEKAYRLRLDEDEDEEGDVVDAVLARKLSRMHIDEEIYESEEYVSSDSDDDDNSYTKEPIPDDTKLFFTEVIDSLTRGFEDNLQCDNLILEINSSRYAYNVTVKEVNFNVVKAILIMSLRQPIGPQYFSHFVRLLSYFSPVLKNYLRNADAMFDSLQAIEEVATTSDKVTDKWVMFLLQYLYDKEYLAEEIILKWFEGLDDDSDRLREQVRPFTVWLTEAEEESDDD